MDEPVVVKAYQQKSDGTLAILIPKPLQRKLGVEKGAQLVAFESEGRLVCVPINKMRGLKSFSDSESP